MLSRAYARQSWESNEAFGVAADTGEAAASAQAEQVNTHIGNIDHERRTDHSPEALSVFYTKRARVWGKSNNRSTRPILASAQA
jgi:hypothetical protein